MNVARNHNEFDFGAALPGGWSRVARDWLLRAILALGLVGGFGLRAQNTDSLLQTNDVPQAEEMTTGDDNGATDDLGAPTEAGETNAAASSTNQMAAPGPDARARRLLRQKQLRSRSYRQANGNSQASATATNNGPASLDYSAFRIVADRNIFDPNRQAHNPGVRVQPKTIDAFTLVGTLSYEKGDFAFFDGTSSDYKKVLKAADSIGGYKVLSVLPDAVKLAHDHDTNELVLAVGTQLRRQEDGTWIQATTPTAYTAGPASSSNGPAQPETAASGSESDIIKRMMQRREKE